MKRFNAQSETNEDILEEVYTSLIIQMNVAEQFALSFSQSGDKFEPQHADRSGLP